MKTLIIIGAVVLVSLPAVITFWVGLTVGIRRGGTKAHRKLGFTRKGFKLYKECAQIFHDMLKLDLDSAYTGDILSAKTRQRIEAWLTDYEKDNART